MTGSLFYARVRVLCFLSIGILTTFGLCSSLLSQWQTTYTSIREITIDDSLQDSLQNGSLSSVDLVRTYLARISEVNSKVHAIAEVNPHALEVARELDIERSRHGPRSNLHGIPILVKDSISVHGMNNTAGSFCLEGARRKNEASLITRLREAGAIILGKATMSEWGNGRSSPNTSSNGWSARGGQTYGIYHDRQDPCGSSSGSAVSTALGLAAVSIGVETVGSITCPAMRSNLVSIKPTSGLVALDNIIVTKLRGTAGPIARSVRDAATVLSVIAGPSQDDHATKKIPFSTIPTYEKSCKVDGLRNRRLGIPRNALNNPISKNMNTKPVMEAFEQMIEVLKANEVTVIDNANYSLYDEMNVVAPQRLVGPAEYKADMTDYFTSLEANPHNIHNMEDLISCTKHHPREEYPDRDVKPWEKAREALDYSSEEVAGLVDQMKLYGGPGGIDGALAAAKADALIFPSIVSSDVPGLVGYPVITVPLGFMPSDSPVTKNVRGDLVDEGPNIPYGLSFIGRPFSEELLIELAYAFEQLTQVANQGKPILLPKLELADMLSQKQEHHDFSSQAFILQNFIMNSAIASCGKYLSNFQPLASFRSITSMIHLWFRHEGRHLKRNCKTVATNWHRLVKKTRW